MEFFEDLWESDPTRARTMLGAVEGDIVLETGDAELDDIERRLAAGEDPDVVLDGWGEGLGDEEFADDYRFSDEPASGGLSWSRKD